MQLLPPEFVVGIQNSLMHPITDPYFLLGVIGGVASIVSLAISAPTAKTRIVHAFYGLILMVAVGLGTVRLMKVTESERALHFQVEQITKIERQAKALLSTSQYSSTTDVGENRGFILAGLAFLEKNKATFPDLYELAKRLAIDGFKVGQSAGSVGSPEYYDEQKRMNDGAQSMKAMLRGIAGGKD